MTDRTAFKPVRELPPEVARKIAAGEVIDRPAAVVRELLDNAIDAGADKITVEISGGGIERIRVSDNGSGMTAEDLAICTKTHTTSKISSEDDLLTLSTLGFRGEALSSIQAVSRLEITTTRNGRDAWKLSLGKIAPASQSAGTVVCIDGLFENFPARKQFLKRPAAETSLCKQTFIEKALAWPGIEFRFATDGTVKQILQKAETRIERCLDVLEPKEPDSFFYSISGSGPGFSFTAVLGSPEVVRSDRRSMMVFINGRRIYEYALLQALDYGAEGHFPNGTHPFALLFVDIEPELADFNIHPAKREVRFRDGAPLHHAVSQAVRDFFRNYTIASMRREDQGDRGESQKELAPAMYERPAEQRQNNGFPHPVQEAIDRAAGGYPRFNADSFRTRGPSWDSLALDSAQMQSRRQDSPESAVTRDFRYVGQVLGTFLAVEREGIFYLIDQHAAHERILYDELFEHAGEKQELLVPYRIETSSEAEDRMLAESTDELDKAGFRLVSEGDGIWQVTAVPVRWRGSRKELSDEILDPSCTGKKLVSKLYATSACRAACKDGSILDPETASRIIASAFALKEPVCPHGRPVWIAMSRDELFRKIGRL